MRHASVIVIASEAKQSRAIARRLPWIASSLRSTHDGEMVAELCPLLYDENLTADRPSFVTHLECSLTGERYPADAVHTLSRAGKPLLVRYDLVGVSQALGKAALAKRPPDLWRYRELLPVRRREDIVSLGEAVTPLIGLPTLARKHGAQAILVKDEGRLPTGSFKARGLVMAVSMAKGFGIKHMAMPTNGNAGAALAAYATRAGIKSTVFCPEDTPDVNIREIEQQGAKVYRVNGLIDDCGKIVAEGKATVGWFDTSTLKEPYRIEGKKTMGLELAEQLGWELPDVIFYPTGGGTGLIGMWKAFDELEAIGFIDRRRPRMVAVQAAGCAPIVRAWEAGAENAPRWEGAQTIAAGIRVPQAIGDFLILRAVRESGGFAIAVGDDAITAAVDEVAREEGLLLCPEGAATYAAAIQALADGRIRKSDRIVLFNCATGLKYPLVPVHRALDRHKPIDFARL
jgi:threonine synthase